ncbi:MAG: acyl-CoA thioesterase II [Deltaproteobacteria bacterium]|nr:acyl-CoA thioesterase II [Deltaproteobacteria bacterium]MBW2382578.1 acyl-CoA thioesterase II [Deltaproteobacteria bacterium]
MSQEARASEGLPALLETLDLEEIDENIYRGQNEPGRPGRLFGGQVAAQSLVAAGRTVRGVPVHSLHGYFLRPGDPAVPVVYTVDRIRDGRSFSTRRVVAQQRGKAIFNMAASFHEAERGYTHQLEMPDAPPPEEVASWREHIERLTGKIPEQFREMVKRERPVETRHVHPPTFLGGPTREGPSQLWIRAREHLGDDPFLHQCVLTYATDISLVDCVLQPHGSRGELGPMMTASLDHAIWFHRPLRMDEWLLYHIDSPAAYGARGLSRGSVYTQAGVLVASTSQEALVRPVSNAEDRSQ